LTKPQLINDNLEEPSSLPILTKDFKSKKIPKGTFEVLNPDVFSDKYRIDKHLGEGAFGSVKRCILKDQKGALRAVKLVRKS